MYREEDERLVQVRPSKRQVKQQEMEYYGFIHFSVNSFTHREWGDGTESEEIFNPTSLDVSQWTDTAKRGGMKGLILTCKHHDGFCLWPSRHTSHTIAASPYKGGKGDVVKELSEACKEAGLRFGVYLSPWDRNHPSYGYGESYNDYFVNQLTELLTNYGEIFTVWFDGACGEGSNGKKQVYDWERYYKVIRELQPNACISVCGSDIRWCGNEAGATRPSEWSVVPKRLCKAETISENSQKEDNETFQKKTIRSEDMDLGSRERLKGETDLIWYPAEVDTSCRPGWFYSPENDGKAYSFERLKEIYLKSVGGNAMLLLNMPPNDKGLIPEYDRARILELGDFIQTAFQNNLVAQARLTAEKEEKNHGIECVRKEWDGAYFKTEERETEVAITIEWNEEQEIQYLVLKENIELSQRVEQFALDALIDGKEETIYQGTTVGYKKIAELGKIHTKKLTLRILDSRVSPTLSFIGVY